MSKMTKKIKVVNSVFDFKYCPFCGDEANSDNHGCGQLTIGNKAMNFQCDNKGLRLEVKP